MTFSFLCGLCMWISLVCPSLGTGFVYHFPGITLQRQRIKSEQSGGTGPPGSGSRTQLRCAHTGLGSNDLRANFPVIKPKRQNKNQKRIWCAISNRKAGFNHYNISFIPSFRNWCQYTVSKTVSCQVHNGTETTVQGVLQGCRWPGPCTKVIRYTLSPVKSTLSFVFSH